jgi:hypothetical protein
LPQNEQYMVGLGVSVSGLASLSAMAASVCQLIIDSQYRIDRLRVNSRLTTSANQGGSCQFRLVPAAAI